MQIILLRDVGFSIADIMLLYSLQDGDKGKRHVDNGQGTQNARDHNACFATTFCKCESVGDFVIDRAR